MKQLISRTFLLGVSAAGITAGCASNAELASVERQAEAARMSANQSMEVARNAERMAEQAEDRARDTEEMVNRSFARSMRK